MRPMDYKTKLAQRGWVVSGGRLEVPRTAAQRVLLNAKLLRLKREFLKRQEES